MNTLDKEVLFTYQWKLGLCPGSSQELRDKEHEEAFLDSNSFRIENKKALIKFTMMLGEQLLSLLLKLLNPRTD